MRNKIVGVSYNKRVSKWESYINFNKKTYNLGYFEDKKDAIETVSYTHLDVYKRQPFI